MSFIGPRPPLWDAGRSPTPVRPIPLRAGEVEEALTRLLPSEKIEQFARETGFVRRERKINLVPCLVGEFEVPEL